MKRHEMVQAGKRFLQALREADLDRNEQISLEEFKIAFQKKVIFKMFLRIYNSKSMQLHGWAACTWRPRLTYSTNVRFSDNFRPGLVT